MQKSQYMSAEKFFLNNIIRYNTLDSTNAEIKRLAEKKAPHGTVVIAEEQQKGRGRSGRNWHSPSGKGLWFSILMRPRDTLPEKVYPVTAVTAVTVIKTIKEITSLPGKIKWPNDLFINGRKAAGILAELKTKDNKIDHIIIGIGININQEENDFPEEIAATATSVFIEKKTKTDLNNFFYSALNKLEDSYNIFMEKGFTPFRSYWIRNNITLGKTVSIKTAGGGIDGTALDIDNEGSLILEDKDKIKHRINYGEIE